MGNEEDEYEAEDEDGSNELGESRSDIRIREEDSKRVESRFTEQPRMDFENKMLSVQCLRFRSH